jgi:hypothetical protein
MWIHFAAMRGRKKKSPEEARSTHIRIRVTTAERAEILSRAIKSGAKTESEWIRRRLLGAKRVGKRKQAET